jgi:DNA (cytosine-5)-methyltransferase 1
MTRTDSASVGTGTNMRQNVYMTHLALMPETDETTTLLAELRSVLSQREIAEKLHVSIKTIGRWERGETTFPPYLLHALRSLILVDDEDEPEESAFRTIDLFAGIGGIRTGFAAHGGTCVFTSEWNDFSKKTYLENYKHPHKFVGDITTYSAKDVPDHDVLLAGFPCQPFSIAGVSKKNSLGRAHGFLDLTQGTLFFDVARIIDEKRPAAFLLENVKNLISHDKGNTFRIILKTLQDELGYEVHYKVVDGGHFTPQHRERILIVGFAEPTNFTWDDLDLPQSRPLLGTILHKTDGTEPFIEHDGDRYFDHDQSRVQSKFTLTANLWTYLQAYAKKHKEAGNGFGFGLVNENSVSRTLSARYYKDGSEILLSQGDDARPRRLTPRECARLMGYPDEFRIPVSDTQSYRQFGNSVVVPVIDEVARIMKPHILSVIAAKSDSPSQLAKTPLAKEI